MRRDVCMLSALLVSLSWAGLQAASAADEPVSMPVETVPVIYVVVFGIVFVGMIVGFFGFLWWKEKRRDRTPPQ